MKFKIKKAITSSQRQLIQLNKNHLQKKPLLKTKLTGTRKVTGRNNTGQITVRHKGGGHKQKYRKINFLRTINAIEVVCSLEYDPKRNGEIASVYNLDKKAFSYILAPKGLKVGDIVQSGPNAEVRLGHSLPLSEIPVGSYIYNLAPAVNKQSQISRSAGTFSKLMEKTLEYAKIQLSSGEVKLLSPRCYASIGVVSNDLAFLTRLGKAGRSRWLNRRPTVRGVAMNPVDHPHGGGEGKKSGKGMTPWGKSTKPGTTSNSKHKLTIKKKKKHE